MPEIDPLVLSYYHLPNFPRPKDALQTLRKVASLVKPIMRARGWKVGQLAEFYPEQHNLLGLNVNQGQKICLRLRYPGDRNQFLPIEQVVDTMLHELSHNVIGPHNAQFHALWNQLREEHEGLVMKGYSGEGFLSEGHRLGGQRIPMYEARRLARAAAERRRALTAGSGQRLGGAAPRPGQDIRKVIVDAVERRNKTLQGCATDQLSQDEIREIADTATRNGFRTQAEEDAANEAAISQALWELVQEDEKAKYGDAYRPPTAFDPTGNGGGAVNLGEVGREENNPPPVPIHTRPPPPVVRNRNAVVEAPTTWTCQICTLHNPIEYLCCDACGTERPEETTKEIARSAKRQWTMVDLTKPSSKEARTTSSTASTDAPKRLETTAAKSKTWTCSFCGRVRESTWWSCDLCGKIKDSS